MKFAGYEEPRENAQERQREHKKAPHAKLMEAALRTH